MSPVFQVLFSCLGYNGDQLDRDPDLMELTCQQVRI